MIFFVGGAPGGHMPPRPPPHSYAPAHGINCNVEYTRHAQIIQEALDASRTKSKRRVNKKKSKFGYAIPDFGYDVSEYA